MIQLYRVFSLSLSQIGFTPAHLVCTTRATARWSKTFARISEQLTERKRMHRIQFCGSRGSVHVTSFARLSSLLSWNYFFMKYMHAIGQHERLSLANGMLQMFSQADKLRPVSRGMPGKKKKKKKKRIFKSQNWKSNANPPNEYSNNRIFWSSPNYHPNKISMFSIGLAPSRIVV